MKILIPRTPLLMNKPVLGPNALISAGKSTETPFSSTMCVFQQPIASSKHRLDINFKIDSSPRNFFITVIFKKWNCCQQLQNDDQVTVAFQTVTADTPRNQEFCPARKLVINRPCENQPFCCSYTDWAEWTEWATSDWQEGDDYKT